MKLLAERRLSKLQETGAEKKVKAVVSEKMTGNSWLRRLLFKSKCSPKFYVLLLISSQCLSTCILAQANGEPEVVSPAAQDNKQEAVAVQEASRSIPANHRSDDESYTPAMGGEGEANKSGGSRSGRQYDGTLSGASSAGYGTISGDGATYMAQVPLASSTGYGSGTNSVGYAGDMAGGSYHDPLAMGRGYHQPSPSGHMHGHGPYQGSGYSSGYSPSFAGGGFGGAGTGLLSSSMFPLMSKGFDVSEIVCTAIAVAIGAVIIGAPFILIYLFVMNQVNGGNSNMGTSGGAISLTGPSSSTNVSGRKKRHTTFPEALFKQLSPLVNSEQVASTFKSLMNSFTKYSM